MRKRIEKNLIWKLESKSLCKHKWTTPGQNRIRKPVETMNSEPSLFSRVAPWTAHCVTAGETEEEMKSEKAKRADPGLHLPGETD